MKRYAIVATLIWTSLIAGFCIWNISREQDQIRELAIKEARANFNKDLAFRYWATMHGGVYVKPDKRTPPNPYLKHLPERDVITTDGKQLTLMNPAYMLRQVMDEYAKMYGITGRITSLKALNPNNAPDEWERNALLEFEDGVQEVTEFTMIDNAPYLRLMRPLITKKGCLKCHSFQGYEVGDVRGGVGVAVPMTGYFVLQREAITTMLYTYGVIWAIGFLSIILIHRKSEQQYEERKKAEKMLIESEGLLRTLIDTIPDLIWLKDTEGRYLSCNQRFEKFFGAAEEDIVGKIDYDFVGEAQADLFIMNDRRAIETATPVVNEEWITFADDGHRELLETIKTSMKDSSGRIIGVLGIGRDITARKKAEEQISMLSRIAEQVYDSVITVDLDHRISYVNDAFQKLYGYVPEEVYGESPDMLNLETGCSDFWNMLEKTGIWNGEIENRKKDGSVFCCEQTVFPILSDTGAVLSYAIIQRDITEQKKLTDELHKTQKLESVGVLAGGIAHDFNNLLAAILNNLFIIKSRTVSDKVIQERVDSAEKASIRARDLTQQLLTFSRGGAPVKELSNIGKLVRESVELSLMGANVRAELHIPEDLHNVDVDRGQMNQVFNNIIINAKQAMPDGGVIHIRCQNMNIGLQNVMALEPGLYIQIIIKDSGTGIAVKDIKKIFDPYFTTKEEGSGLGLASVYSIIKRHKGNITVESEIGKGTAFVLYIPATMKKISEDPDQLNLEIQGEGKILIMDDDEFVRESLGEMLKILHYTPIYAKNGSEAIAAYKELLSSNSPVKAIVMDLTIPGAMGGREAIQELLKIDADVRAIVSSGYSYDEVISNYSEYGFRAVLRKPFKGLDDLGKVLKSVI
ncbi:MAG: PAS domain S-box protein [Nitrospira sp.]|nr:PAS domain S-box protein [bacterium]MBL7049620.1 PAS domain S-box protein [Nitrospira sp.]